MIPTPEAVFERLRRQIPPYIKWSFAAAVIMGLVAHLYVFTNLLPNHDGINHLFQCDYGTQSGRWLLPTVLQWDGDFNMPWLLGLLSLLCLAGTVCFTTSLLRIHGRLAIIVTAALLTAFPTVAATFSYMFTADAYFFGLFLAAFAAYAVERMPIMGLQLGTIALILSMAIYQSYFPVAAVLMVGALLFNCLEGKLSVAGIFLRGIKMVATLGLGIVVYMAAARWITARSGGLSDYMGISSMGSLSLSDLPQLVRDCYDAYTTYFFSNDLGWFFSFTSALMQIAFVCALVILLTLLLERRVGILRAVLAIVLLICYPLAGSLIHIMVAGADVHDLMIYGMVYVLVLPVALASFACEQITDTRNLKRALQSLMSWIILLAMGLTGWNFIVTDNKAYLKMDVSFEQIKAYSNRLVTAIQSVEGYTTEMPVVLLGYSNGDAMLDVTPELNEIYLTGVLGMGTYRTQYSYNALLTRFLALPNDIYLDTVSEEMRAAIGDTSQMPVYPQSGSVQVINGYIVVRLT